jgi:hypothetical protein
MRRFRLKAVHPAAFRISAPSGIHIDSLRSANPRKYSHDGRAMLLRRRRHVDAEKRDVGVLLPIASAIRKLIEFVKYRRNSVVTRQ